MKGWGFSIIMKGLPKIKQDYLNADINFFRARLKMEAWRDLQMFVKSRDKIKEVTEKYTLFKGLKLTDTAIQSVEGFFDMLSMDEFNIMDFSVVVQGNETTLNVIFNQEYFDVWESIKKGSRLHALAFRNPMTSKESLLKQFKKQIEAEYTKDYDVKTTQ